MFALPRVLVPFFVHYARSSALPEVRCRLLLTMSVMRRCLHVLAKGIFSYQQYATFHSVVCETEDSSSYVADKCEFDDNS